MMHLPIPLSKKDFIRSAISMLEDYIQGEQIEIKIGSKLKIELNFIKQGNDLAFSGKILKGEQNGDKDIEEAKGRFPQPPTKGRED